MGISFPNSDPGLLGWSLNFATRISAGPVPLGLTALQAAAYQTLHDNFGTALAACEPGVRSKSSVATKNEARQLLKDQARLLASIIDGQASVSDATKLELGLTVRSAPSPIPAPGFSPVIDIMGTNGHTVTIKIHGPDEARRGLPDGVDGITICSCVSEELPTNPAQFQFEANTTRSIAEIVFPDSVLPGKKVWVTAFYFNERKSRVLPLPASAIIQFGGMSMVA